MSTKAPTKTVNDTNALEISISRLKRLMLNMPPTISLMIRGRHGIGKSQLVYQVASELRSEAYKNVENCIKLTRQCREIKAVTKALKNFWSKNADNPAYEGYPANTWHYDMGLPVLEYRLSTMQDGDMSGIPFLRAVDENGFAGGTVFAHTEWLRVAHDFPVMLFLDELNRAATKALEQGTFQLSDSRAFNGLSLHDETRFVTAINLGAAYDTIELDHASVSRYAVVDLNPTVEDWIEWARVNCHPNMVSFHASSGGYLDPTQDYQNTAKMPDRRAWGQLDEALRNLGLYARSESREFEDLCCARVGYSQGHVFAEYCRKQSTEISPEEVLNDWSTAKMKMESFFTDDKHQYNKKLLELMEKLKTHMTADRLSKCTDVHLKNLALFADSLPAEIGQSVHGLFRNNPELQAQYSRQPEAQRVARKAKPDVRKTTSTTTTAAAKK